MVMVKQTSCQWRRSAISRLIRSVRCQLTRHQLAKVERLEQRRARARRSARPAPDLVRSRGRDLLGPVRARSPSASRSSLASSTRKRGSTVAGSHATRSRRQAGPPPLAIDWRTSTIIDPADRAVDGEVPLDPRRDRRRVAALGRRDQGHRAVGRGHQLGVEQIGADRVGQRHVGVGDLDIFELRAPRRAAGRAARALSAKACSCANSTGPLATATTSLWNAPAAIASSDCAANRTRAGIERGGAGRPPSTPRHAGARGRGRRLTP